MQWCRDQQVVQQSAEDVRRSRLPVQPSLGAGAPKCEKHLCHVGVFHALGDGLDPECQPELDNGPTIRASRLRRAILVTKLRSILMRSTGSSLS